jgi:hypothetical protein
VGLLIAAYSIRKATSILVGLMIGGLSVRPCSRSYWSRAGAARIGGIALTALPGPAVLLALEL